MKTNFTHFVNRNTTLARHLILACLVIVGFNSFAQTAGDYRSATSGFWSVSSTWERYNGSAWVASPPAPSSSDETITIRSGHNVTISTAVTADQVVVGAGGTLTQNADLNLANGAGDDLIVNGIWNWQGSEIGSPGNALISAGGTLNLTTDANKFVAGNITNTGTMNWQDGEIYFSNNPTITNNGTWIISGNNNMSTNNTQGSVVNTGTINKTSAGITMMETASFSNSGTINFSAGTLESNSGAFDANAGSVINGTGTFKNTGTVNLNVDQEFPATLMFDNFGTVDGPGNLTINNDFTFSGVFSGAGAIFLNGNATWAGGSIGRSTFTAVETTFSFTTADNKFVDANITNNGTMNWQDGEIYFANNPTITNNGTWIISGNNNMSYYYTAGSVVNTGTINKTSTAITTMQTASFSNSGTINFNDGTLASNSEALINTGNLTSNSGTFNNTGTLNANTGSVINGTGNFNNIGTFNLNVNQEFPATLVFGNSGTVDGPGNLTINNDCTFSGNFTGAGSMFLNGNSTWTGGNIGRSTFSSVGKTFNFTTGDNKFVDANITNNGTMNWQDGEIYFANNPVITNNGTWIISGNNNMSYYYTAGSVVNTGTINKTSTGTTSMQTASFSNSGTINFSAGTLESNSGAFDANAGSVINGTGIFKNTGTVNLNVNQEFPATLVFGNFGTVDGPGNLTINNDFTFSGVFSGAGAIFLNGNATWTGGNIGRSTFSAVGTTFNFTTADNKFVDANITNNGTMNWQDGEIYFANNPVITNNGTWIISGNNTMASYYTDGSVVNSGTINKTSTGTTSMTTAAFTNNNGATIKGLGTYTMNSGAFNNNGTIAPGSSPGLLTINTNQPLSANSTLAIEMFDGSGAGTGHDQLVRNGNLTLAGILTVTETGTVPNGTYIIVSLTSGNISGSFASVNLPAGYTYQVNANTVSVTRLVPTIDCPANRIVTAQAGQCSAVVDNIDPAVEQGQPFTYTLSGANTGSGSGTASGLSFNSGVTTVTYTLTNFPVFSCSFTVTVNTSIVPSVSIGASATNICEGDNVTFTAYPNNGGTPTYHWKLNGQDVGSNSSVFEVITPANGDSVSVAMTSSISCASPATVNSNQITITFGLGYQLTASAGADVTVCYGESVALAGTVENTESSIWLTSGDGTFEDAGSLATTYNPGYADLQTGLVTITLNALPVLPCDVSATDNLTITVNLCQNLTIPAGWSGISGYVQPTDASVENIFNPVIGNLIILQSETGVYWPGQNINTILSWSRSEGYKIKTLHETQISFAGQWNSNNQLPLSANWNTIPVLSSCPVNVADLFGGTNVTIVKEVAGWRVYWPAFGIHTLGTVDAGRAYYVSMSAGANISFPDCEAGKYKAGGFDVPERFAYSLAKDEASFTPFTHTIAFSSGLNFELGTQILAYDEQGECCGIAEWQKTGTALTVFGDDPFTNLKDGAAEGEQLTFVTINPDGFEQIMEVAWDETLPNSDGRFYNNGLSAMKEATMSASYEFSGTEDIAVFPNPANGFVVVASKCSGGMMVQIVNQIGVNCLDAKTTESVSKIDISGLSKGIYMVIITCENKSVVKKLVVE